MTPIESAAEKIHAAFNKTRGMLVCEIAAIITEELAGEAVAMIDGKVPELIPTDLGRFVIVAKGTSLRFQLTTDRRWYDCESEVGFRDGENFVVCDSRESAAAFLAAHTNNTSTTKGT